LPLTRSRQIFEAMGDYIPEPMFYEWALPCMKRIADELRARHPGVPLLVFPRGATYSLAALQVAQTHTHKIYPLVPESRKRMLGPNAQDISVWLHSLILASASIICSIHHGISVVTLCPRDSMPP